MLSLLGNVLSTILGAYLAMTNTVADMVIVLLDLETAQPDSHMTAKSSSLPALPSEYEYGGGIPSILVDNAAYQAASVGAAALDTGSATTNIAEALVNILCTYTTDTYIRTNTGTGFFVNKNGVILTNAHVAQFLLLQDVTQEGETKCIIRTGSPAEAAYEAELLYIPPAWVQQNASQISDSNPVGTGERDYALLYVTAGVDNKPIPARLPYLKTNTDLLDTEVRNDTVTIGGYPAEKLRTQGASFVPIQAVATTSIAELFTFGSTYADIFNVRGNSIGQQGVSGGPVMDAGGNVIGLISTKGDEQEFGAGALNAITLSYVSRTIAEETGFGFIENTSGNLSQRAQVFKETLTPFLSVMLKRELE